VIYLAKRVDARAERLLPLDAKTTNWPFCAKCMALVKSYRVGEERYRQVSIVATCNGPAHHPAPPGVTGWPEEKEEIWISAPPPDARKARPGWLGSTTRLLTFFAGHLGSQAVNAALAAVEKRVAPERNLTLVAGRKGGRWHTRIEK
jgi:hypothetical protein